MKPTRRSSENSWPMVSTFQVTLQIRTVAGPSSTLQRVLSGGPYTV
jgi:hypothetical protein